MPRTHWPSFDGLAPRWHCHVNFVRAASGRGADHSCVLKARLVMPDFESVRPDGAIGVGCKLVSAGMEVTVDECVGGEEVLCLSGRFEPLHLPLSSPCRSM